MKRSYFFLALPLLFTACSNNSSTPPAVVISSVTVVSSPTKATYTVGEYFEPSGLAVKVTKSDESNYTVSYLENEEDFSFSPSLATALTSDIDNITGTYEGFNFSIPVSVSDSTSKFTADFTTLRTETGGVKTTGDTKSTNFITTLQTYYFNSSEFSLTAIEGGYVQIKTDEKKIYVTETRPYDQLVYLTGRNNECDFTLTFNKTIKSVTFVCEAYSKYISYNATQNVDYDTYLKVNDVKRDIPAHSVGDIDETQELKYTVNSSSIRIEVPNEHIDDTKNNRIIVYQMILEF